MGTGGDGELAQRRILTALTLAKPVLTGARQALPYMRHLGGHNLILAGAVAVGAVATGELVKRTWGAARRGTVQGSALSPLLANLYLHPFDVALTSQGLRLVRFMDDFVIMCASQPEAEQTLTLVQRQLATFHLTLNTDKTRVINYVDGLEFLGQALAPRRGGPRLGQGLASFEEAEQALRAAAGKVRRRFKKT
jgi:RNA-directed DNA polymerase